MLQKKLVAEFVRFHIMRDIRSEIFDHFNKEYTMNQKQISDMIARILFFKGEKRNFFPNIDMNKKNTWEDSIILKMRYFTNDPKGKFTTDIKRIKRIFSSSINRVEMFINKMKDITVIVKHKKLGNKHKLTNNVNKDISFLITNELYNKLYNTIKDGNEDKNEIVFLTLMRYEVLLDSKNHQLGIRYANKNIMDYDVELFASPINRTLNEFCSAYPDVDSYYNGNLGSYFNYDMKSNKKYTFNPPYDEPLMTNAIKRLISQMKRKKNIHVYITIPVWDICILRAIDLDQHISKEMKCIEYIPYTLLLDSDLVTSIGISSYKDYRYYDHFKNKVVSVAHTFTIIVDS